GYSSSIDVTSRLEELARGLISRRIDIAWEINTRIDQIIDYRHSSDWHLKRWGALTVARNAGLRRILVGVESGSVAILDRFVKGQTVEQCVKALRVLSMLGIDIRVTFITFDQLMSSEELSDNFIFLGRADAILRRPLETSDESPAKI